jgi:hypothetical protein
MALHDKAFRGWPAEALQFYEGLEADNSRFQTLDSPIVSFADCHWTLACTRARMMIQPFGAE